MINKKPSIRKEKIKSKTSCNLHLEFKQDIATRYIINTFYCVCPLTVKF